MSEFIAAIFIVWILYGLISIIERAKANNDDDILGE